MAWSEVVRALPEIIRIIKFILREVDARRPTTDEKPKDLKEKLQKIEKAMKEKDEKTLNDIFNSL